MCQDSYPLWCGLHQEGDAQAHLRQPGGGPQLQEAAAQQAEGTKPDSNSAQGDGSPSLLVRIKHHNYPSKTHLKITKKDKTKLIVPTYLYSKVYHVEAQGHPDDSLSHLSNTGNYSGSCGRGKTHHQDCPCPYMGQYDWGWGAPKEILLTPKTLLESKESTFLTRYILETIGDCLCARPLSSGPSTLIFKWGGYGGS